MHRDIQQQLSGSVRATEEEVRNLASACNLRLLQLCYGSAAASDGSAAASDGSAAASNGNGWLPVLSESVHQRSSPPSATWFKLFKQVG